MAVGIWEAEKGGGGQYRGGVGGSELPERRLKSN